MYLSRLEIRILIVMTIVVVGFLAVVIVARPFLSTPTMYTALGSMAPAAPRPPSAAPFLSNTPDQSSSGIAEPAPEPSPESGLDGPYDALFDPLREPRAPAMPQPAPEVVPAPVPPIRSDSAAKPALTETPDSASNAGPRVPELIEAKPVVPVQPVPAVSNNTPVIEQRGEAEAGEERPRPEEGREHTPGARSGPEDHADPAPHSAEQTQQSDDVEHDEHDESEESEEAERRH